MARSYVGVLAVTLMCLVNQASAHGRLLEPPSRSSAWRFGFDTPPNYNDNQLFCGGKWVQWNQNGGKCGICGDPYQGPRLHEAGGPYATGAIVRSYPQASAIEITVELTANHLGWFEFRLCPHNDVSTPASQECLDRYILQKADGSGARTNIDSTMRMITVLYQLPVEVTCSQCILQWKYNTGNSWGTDAVTGQGCLGCGPQEQFYGCSDIAIQDGMKPPATASTTTTTTTSRPPPATDRPTTSSPTNPPSTRPILTTTTTTTTTPITTRSSAPPSTTKSSSPFATVSSASRTTGRESTTVSTKTGDVEFLWGIGETTWLIILVVVGLIFVVMSVVVIFQACHIHRVSRSQNASIASRYESFAHSPNGTDRTPPKSTTDYITAYDNVAVDFSENPPVDDSGIMEY